MREPRQFRLYSVAFYKHDDIQCLLAGPWVSLDDAQQWIDNQKMMRDTSQYVLVETELPFNMVGR